jgi:hypothetical protein
MDDKKIIENNQAEKFSGGVVTYDPRELKCDKCRSQNIRREVLFTSPGDPKSFRMTCRDCGRSWIETERIEKW